MWTLDRDLKTFGYLPNKKQQASATDVDRRYRAQSVLPSGYCYLYGNHISWMPC